MLLRMYLPKIEVLNGQYEIPGKEKLTTEHLMKTLVIQRLLLDGLMKRERRNKSMRNKIGTSVR